MFSEACVKNSVHRGGGGVHGRGCAWQEGVCGRGVCVAGGMHGRRGVHGRGACMVGGMHGRGMHGRGHA